MSKWIRASIAVMALVPGLLCAPISVAGPALAVSQTDPSCPNTPGHSWVPRSWTRSDNAINGVRAPVETSFDTLLCLPMSDAPFAAGWIGIQNQSATALAQAGIIHLFYNGNGAWCRFWAIGSGISNLYDCGGQSNGTYIYFSVTKYSNTQGSFYGIQDCGTGGGYGNCTVLNAGQSAFIEPQGDVSAEDNYYCTVQIMGSGSSPQNFGTSTNPIQGLVNDWGPRTWNYNSADNHCLSDYESSQASGSTSATISIWDRRN